MSSWKQLLIVSVPDPVGRMFRENPCVLQMCVTPAYVRAREGWLLPPVTLGTTEEPSAGRETRSARFYVFGVIF